MYRRLLGIGIPLALQSAVTGIGALFYQSSLNQLNIPHPGIITGCTCAEKINGIFSSMQCSFVTSIASYVGQNYGAGQKKRILTGVHSAFLFSPFLGALAIYRTALQCIGHSQITVAGGFLEVFGRCFMAFIGVKFFGYIAIFLVESTAFLCADLLMVPLFYYCIKKLKFSSKTQKRMGFSPCVSTFIFSFFQSSRTLRHITYRIRS